MTKSKIKFTVFLDFDGVLHPTIFDSKNCFIRLPNFGSCIEPFLDSIEIVITSSWRFQYELIELVKLFPKSIQDAIVNTTGNAHIGQHARYVEINNYVRDFGVVSWVAIDDSRYEFPDLLPDNIILCNPAIGFSGIEAKRLGDLLGDCEA
jgi:HAD domain in Swiss Army Knife RNA repair proteins